MLITELETFVQKFHQLWSAGHSAHLDLETHNGRAWVGLCVQLGRAPGILYQQPHPQPFQKAYKKKDSPSRQRRRTRRAATRQASSEEVVNEKVVNEEIVTENLPNKDAEKAKESEPISTSVKVVVNEAMQVSIKNKVIDNESNVAAVQVEKETEAEQVSVANVEDPGDIIDTEITVIEEITDEVCNDDEYLETSEKPKEFDRPVIDNVQLKSQYPRHCEKCEKYLRNNLDFRKHVVACMMARK